MRAYAIISLLWLLTLQLHTLSALKSYLAVIQEFSHLYLSPLYCHLIPFYLLQSNHTPPLNLPYILHLHVKRWPMVRELLLSS